MQDFGNNYAGDSKVKIPWVRRDLSGARVLVMEWIDGMRCTNIRGIQTSGIDVNEFIRCGVVSGLRQLLEVRGGSAAARVGPAGFRCLQRLVHMQGVVQCQLIRFAIARAMQDLTLEAGVPGGPSSVKHSLVNGGIETEVSTMSDLAWSCLMVAVCKGVTSVLQD